MNKSKQMTDPPDIWEGQVGHFLWLVGLLAVTAAAWFVIGRPSTIAFWVAVGFPVAHQIWVWIAWRTELRSAAIRKTIGFYGYLIAFFALFGGRFLSLGWLAFADRGSLGLSAAACTVTTLLLLGPGLYAMISVRLYFGMARAAGGDHFEQRYRDMPLVNKGIFRFTSNGMYLYAFLLFWAIAIGLNSTAALIVAAFSHAYIWVHYYATEKPDMRYLYGSGNAG